MFYTTLYNRHNNRQIAAGTSMIDKQFRSWLNVFLWKMFIWYLVGNNKFDVYIAEKERANM